MVVGINEQVESFKVEVVAKQHGKPSNRVPAEIAGQHSESDPAIFRKIMVAKVKLTAEMIHVFFSPLKMNLSQLGRLLVGGVIQRLHRDAAPIGRAMVELQPLAK